ncbi:MAG: HNH endonuclease signature motif containing protein [Anaerolineales bacterium]|nr:HNH endonuclease signature motif containing protein [Anaerolineales bacterium]
MPPNPKARASRELRDAVRRRARGRCEYCHAEESWQYVEFTMEHVTPVSAGGQTTYENLALACFACNRRKWDRLEGFDPLTQTTTRLFNPRLDNWNDHFAWSEDALRVIGRTPVGRATVEALELNRERVQQIRAADVAVGRHPPPEDQRLTRTE